MAKLNIERRNISPYFVLSNLNHCFMSITSTLFPKTDYHFFYDFLLVMSEEQIQKLRRIILGIEKITSFSENEIEELEKKAGHKTGLATLA